MDNLGNLYIEPNLIMDERKSQAIQKRLSDLQCIDNDMKIVVQRVETAAPHGPGASQGTFNPAIAASLNGKRDAGLRSQLQDLLVQANSELNFSNFDRCYNNIVQAISLIERNA